MTCELPGTYLVVLYFSWPHKPRLFPKQLVYSQY